MVISEQEQTLKWSPSQKYDTGLLTSIALDNQGNCLETHVGSVNLYYRVAQLNVADKTVAWSPSQQYDTGSLTSIALDNQGNCLETHVGSVNLYYRVGKLNVTDKTVAWSPSQQYDTGSLTNIALDNQGNCLETHVGSGNLYYRISIIEISYKELGPAGSSIEGKTFSSIQPKVEASKSRIKSIRVNAGWAINKIQVQYENTAASPPEIYDSPAFGREGGTLSEFRLEAGDYLTGVSGSWGAGSPGHPKTEIITLQFHTHKGIKSQEFGGGNPQKQVEPFSLVAPEGWEIVGFFGACGDPDNCLARLGVYSTTPVTAAPLAAVKPEKLQPGIPSMAQVPQSVLEFDGQNNCVNLGKKPTFKIEKNITIEAWIYATTEQKEWTGIVSNIFDTGATESGYGLLFNGKTGIYFGLKIPSQGIEYLSSGANSLKLNEWNHIAGTYDGQQLKVYVNGVEKASKALPSNNIHYNPEKDLLIGMYRDDDEAYPFKGQIAEVRLWNCVRSATELQRDMRQTLAGNEPGLVGYWPLNEGTGTTVQDKTNNANQGTITGSPTWVKAEIPIEVKQQPAPPNLQPVLNFDGQDDFVELAAKSIPSGSEITVNFWSYGGSLSPKHSSIIAAKGPNNERILNIHLPWGESKIYFDSGNQASGFDRIDKVAQASDYKEKWSHWAFTKNVTTGEMKIYLNGELWHSGTGKNMPLIPATRVTLGCFSNSQLYHHGMISELQIWNKARSQDEIKADMARRLVGNEPGLVGYWPLNEGTGTTVQDKTKNANHGTISGNATWVQAEIPIEVKQQPVIASPPNLQPVLNFDGQNDYITCPGAIVANSYTKEAWVKLAEPLSANNVLSGHHHALFMPNGLLAAGHNGQWWFVKDSSTSPANTWLHVAVTYDSQTKVMCLYRDGRLVSQASDVPPFTPSDHALLIGSHLSSSLFRGQISEARVWNKALSQTEIQSNLSHRLVGNEPGLVGYWPLNEGTGTTVQDKTNNGNHGTISGNAVWVQAEIPIEVKQSQPPTAPQEQPQQYIQPEVSVVTQEQPQPDIQPEVAVVTQEQPQPDIQPEAPVVTQEQPQPDIQPEAPVVTQEQPQPDIQPVTPVMTEEQSQADIQPEAPVVAQEQPQPDIQGQPLVIIKEHSESAIVKQPQEQPKKRSYPYRILSIDGGGIRGIIPAMILAEIERRTGKPISSMFDLFAGTSTGGILALGLTKPKPNPNAPAYSEGVPEPAYSAQALVSMFAKYGSEIFYEPIIEELLGNLDDIIKPKYTSEGREDVLKRFFDFTPLQETLKEVFITSYDIELRTPVFFTSNPKKQNTQSHSFRRICRGFTMKQAAMATSAAPTYFSPYRIQTSQSPSSFYNLVDGGVFANNPTSLALMEAMNNAKAAAERGEETWNIDDILVVSLGTGSLTKVYPYNEAKNWGLIGWVRPLINIILDATSQSVSCELEQLLRAPANSQKQYYRFQAYLDERLEPMDNAKAENIRMLTRVAKQIIDEREEDIEELCNELMR
uniref:ORF2 n=1 Tax=Cylindrospermum moravicum CCALA 993 TaxID=1382638 RepID=A0A346GB22_9NOST|nr:ORF2 [Cylindrospermum moravicum CCALA 993]